MNKILSYCLNLIYPPKCMVCSEIISLNNAKLVCEKCADKINFINFSVCPKCSNRLIDNICINCQNTNYVFYKNIAIFPYDDAIRSILHSIKYDKKANYAIKLGEICADYLDTYKGELVGYDYIVPVPLHKNKLRKRGFNQAELMAIPMGKKLNIPVLTDVIYRKVDTMAQSAIQANEREENIKAAFEVGNQQKVMGKNIIVVDDIFTTGSTMNAVSKALMDEKVNKIICISISISLLNK